MKMRGFLVVLEESCLPAGIRRRRPWPYAGVDRMPFAELAPATPDPALDEYLFGQIRAPESNLIPTIASAFRVHEQLSSETPRFEVLFCASDPQFSRYPDNEIPIAEMLGWDVACVRGDYSSIVGYFTSENWGTRYGGRRNGRGLFEHREDAENYLAEYKTRREHDWEMEFEIIFVARVRTPRGASDSERTD
jgi:hypothetical protein